MIGSQAAKRREAEMAVEREANHQSLLATYSNFVVNGKRLTQDNASVCWLDLDKKDENWLVHKDDQNEFEKFHRAYLRTSDNDTDSKMEITRAVIEKFGRPVSAGTKHLLPKS